MAKKAEAKWIGWGEDESGQVCGCFIVKSQGNVAIPLSTLKEMGGSLNKRPILLLEKEE